MGDSRLMNERNKRLKEQVKILSSLEENWDSYGAKPFTKEIIDKVNNIIDCLEDSIIDPSIVPSSCGIQLEWDNGGKCLEVCVDEDVEEMTYVKVVGDDMENWIEGELVDYNEINELIEWLYKEI